MSGSIADQIAALEVNISSLETQIGLDATTDPGAVAGLDVTLDADIANLATLEASICLAKDTYVLTDRGEILVQDLKAGDFVVTPYSTTSCMPVRWIGRQHYEGARMRYGQPVLIRAGALGDGLPHRDLRVSADHNLFFDGHLVPARLLVNNTTIIAESHHSEMDYYNIELDSHTVLMAEGVETESYLDCGNRFRFDNAGEANEWLSTRPSRDSSAWTNGCAFAQMLWEGPKLAALRSRLNGGTASVAAQSQQSFDYDTETMPAFLTRAYISQVGVTFS